MKLFTQPKNLVVTSRRAQVDMNMTIISLTVECNQHRITETLYPCHKFVHSRSDLLLPLALLVLHNNGSLDVTLSPLLLSGSCDISLFRFNLFKSACKQKYELCTIFLLVVMQAHLLLCKRMVSSFCRRLMSHIFIMLPSMALHNLHETNWFEIESRQVIIDSQDQRCCQS